MWAALVGILLGGGAAALVAYAYTGPLQRMNGFVRMYNADGTPRRNAATLMAEAAFRSNAKEAAMSFIAAGAFALFALIFARLSKRAGFLSRAASFLGVSALLTAAATFGMNWEHMIAGL